MESNERAAEFGKHLHRIRTEVFDESLRAFEKRIGLSASYIGKLENGEVGVPKRSTIETISQRMALKRADRDGLLLKAGYVPEGQVQDEDTEYVRMLIGQLTEPQQAAVLAYIQHVRDVNVVRAPMETASS
jgi:transcriptional regulator with XRE-family HTH domain